MANQLPIVHMTLYKHGVGYFRRRGTVAEQALKLTFRREEMDDLLKSLTVIDHGGGQVQGVDYDTPQNQAERLAGCSIILDTRRSLRDLLMALRGREVSLQIGDGSSLTGTLIGLDEAKEEPLQNSAVSLLQADSEKVSTFSLSRIEGVELRDASASADLRFFLQTALGQESHRSITIRLSPGQHDLEVSYIAPAPTWRVSYRLVVDSPAAEGDEAVKSEALLQGWGIFDNRLEEDLNDISLSLTAGMPISFRYDLYTPRTPERPLVEDADRTAAGPVMFEPAAELQDAEFSMRAAEAPAPASAPLMSRLSATSRSRLSTQTMADSVTSAATGADLGELFQYNVSTPVTVGRGQSAMVPIVSSGLHPKKELIYNGVKMPAHPVATLRFDNQTGLTLEQGPVTVLENGEYVGEAVLPFTADRAEAVISYAVELGIHVKEEPEGESQLHALQIKDGYLIQQRYDILRTIYRVDNRTAQPKTVLVEHPRRARYQRFDSPEPVEQTLGSDRYRVEAAAGKITTLTVQERVLQAQREDLRKQSYRKLQDYFENKFLDRDTYEALRALLEVQDEIVQLKQASLDQEKRRVAIYRAQEQIQKNMSALSSSGEEGRLRGRYVQQLTRSEEDLAEIDQTIGQIQADIDRKQARIEQMIASL